MKNLANSRFKNYKRRFVVNFDVSNINYPYAIKDKKFGYIAWNFKFEDDARTLAKYQEHNPTFGRFEVPKCMRIYKT